MTLDDVLSQAIVLSNGGHPDHYIDSKSARATFSTRKTESGKTEPVIIIEWDGVPEEDCE